MTVNLGKTTVMIFNTSQVVLHHHSFTYCGELVEMVDALMAVLRISAADLCLKTTRLKNRADDYSKHSFFPFRAMITYLPLYPLLSLPGSTG